MVFAEDAFAPDGSRSAAGNAAQAVLDAPALLVRLSLLRALGPLFGVAPRAGTESTAIDSRTMRAITARRTRGTPAAGGTMSQDELATSN